MAENWRKHKGIIAKAKKIDFFRILNLFLIDFQILRATPGISASLTEKTITLFLSFFLNLITGTPGRNLPCSGLVSNEGGGLV